MEIVNAVTGVDYVVPWHYTPNDSTVIGALEILKPKFFTKGGDRFDASTIPEWETCQKLACEIITGVGQGKIQSSSELVKNAYEKFEK